MMKLEFDAGKQVVIVIISLQVPPNYIILWLRLLSTFMIRS